MPTNKVRSLFIEDELWKKIKQAAREASVAEGADVSASEFIRRACVEKMDKPDRPA